MIIFIFYVFWVAYSAGLGYLSTLLFEGFGNPLLYLLFLLGILASFFIAFATILLIVFIAGLFRSKKDSLDSWNHRFVNGLLLLSRHLLRVKVIVTGEENIPKEKFVLVANHEESYDAVIVKAIFKDHPLNFIVKESLIKVPIIGKWFGILGCIPISRYADRSAAKSIVLAIKGFEHGNPMGIFPEGKRSFGNEMIEFKPGAFKLAMKPKADIVILTLYNFINIRKNYPFKKQKVYVHIHPLLKYEEYKDLSSHELADKVKAIIQEKLDEYKSKIK